MLKIFRKYLAAKFFISYFVVIIIGLVVLLTATKFIVPRAFERHMTEMTEMMGYSASSLENDLFQNFNSAVNESLLFSGAAAFISAIIVSLFVSRQVVEPLRRVMVATQYISDGHYGERVKIPGSQAEEEMDELAQLSVSFNQMALELEKTETRRKQLIGDVAHELRTPLATIKGSMEGLMDGVLPPTDDSYHQVYQEAERLQHLVDDLQDLSRVEAGTIEIFLEPQSLQELVQTTRNRLERQFEEKGISLELLIPEDIPKVRVDANRIAQVFVNLIGNSLQYTPSGGTVTISAEDHGHHVQVSITDTGIGISQENLSRVFSRFFRVDKSRSRAGGGSGIGLTIAKHLVELQGGEIWAESPGLDKGSTFNLLLPAA